MQALALCTAAAPPRAAAFRPAAPSGRTLRLSVCSTAPGGPSTTPRPPGTRPPSGGRPGGSGPRPGGSGPRPGGSGPRPGGSGPRPGGTGPRPSGPPGQGQQQRRPGGNFGSSSGPGGPPRQGPGGGYRERDGQGGRQQGPRGGRQQRDPYAGVTMNEAIRAPEVRVLAEDRSPLGVMPTRQALAEARAEGLDMILVVPDAAPPVVRLMEVSKFLYEQVKAAKEAKKKQREAVVETKELKLRPATDVHDYQVKVKAAQKFLGKGHRVKLTLQFRGREMEFQQIGREMFQRFVEDCGSDVAIEQAPAMQGRQMSMVLGPAKKEI
ncbi:translation initiation factor IF-3 [Chlorella sorokiniana]|uniref:Translation initiation factor IF-3 n=1 Tax=Chlorella sorokiniana TaxID=3076 RepID=A0A2P6TGM0_CHLSO|nr:translation initiation factor IF-3 [Chlorella sorokiniana]|eukprot:PRW33264.1 translation initiation factor IF-3 [Chlorella sorokiniana]